MSSIELIVLSSGQNILRSRVEETPKHLGTEISSSGLVEICADSPRPARFVLIVQRAEHSSGHLGLLEATWAYRL